MFSFGVRVALGFERAQGGDEFRARLRRFDHGVDVAAFGGDVGIGKALAKLLDFGGAVGCGILRLLQLLPEELAAASPDRREVEQDGLLGLPGLSEQRLERRRSLLELARKGEARREREQ